MPTCSGRRCGNGDAKIRSADALCANCHVTAAGGWGTLAATTNDGFTGASAAIQPNTRVTRARTAQPDIWIRSDETSGEDADADVAAASRARVSSIARATATAIAKRSIADDAAAAAAA